MAIPLLVLFTEILDIRFVIRVEEFLAAEDENHWMSSLKVGELSRLPRVIRKLIVRKNSA